MKILKLVHFNFSLMLFSLNLISQHLFLRIIKNWQHRKYFVSIENYKKKKYISNDFKTPNSCQTLTFKISSGVNLPILLVWKIVS